MQLIFLLLTSMKKPVLINALSIRDIVPMKKGKGSFIMYDDDSSQAVDEDVLTIAAALNDLGILRQPANR